MVEVGSGLNSNPLHYPCHVAPLEMLPKTSPHISRAKCGEMQRAEELEEGEGQVGQSGQRVVI